MKKLNNFIYHSYRYIIDIPILGFFVIKILGILNILSSNYFNLYKIKFDDIKYHSIISQDSIFIVSVSFNNEYLVQNQIKYFKENNLSKKNVLIIADNSSKKEIRKEIKNICNKENIYYISLPRNPWKQVNLSHGVTLNWIYKNFISKYKPFGFGFLDHDNIPVTKFDMYAKLEKFNMYGLKKKKENEKQKAEYLWAGFCFFKYDFISKLNPNFLPIIVPKFFSNLHLDTGGGNYKILDEYRSQALFSEHRFLEDGSEEMDNFVHLRAASFSSEEEIKNKLFNIKQKYDI